MRHTALVTGASSGIGLAIARELARVGVDVVLVARDESRLRQVAASLDTGTEVLAADLLTHDGLEAVAERVALRERPVDILVSNAGFGLAAPFHASSIDDERRLHELLSFVPLRLAHAALPGMRERRRGWILTVASFAAFIPYGSYSASKAHAVNLSRSLRSRYAHDGIRATALCPGFVHTEFHERMGIEEDGPAWMWASADDIARRGVRGLRRNQPVVHSNLAFAAIGKGLQLVPDRWQGALINAYRD
ncbi:SDR family NAD(P)-dependent oxidoreductase [Agrococcus sp. SGAir0287]|uniref:SDR family NAD(P)-dependent oxidoreductase n=1 Tax=Agrococcus sp. SGAir0287 TaxID=2070347 RepID=UPI0010CD047C|nr:SDR family NAD(P)-dependent oxidoreductase [Agrococcus sp. SGAir0287]QCR18912.1 short-chain dehydrogenase [Agrococcus sp. SGAir0287]